ncbi:hypothetical protein GTQ34_12055 [Muricauda sp. JGD-17]|uniref:Lipoprotein n=1 Tax=Flagellimonas ochracea TaxID=2696472 RepID=A0A964TD14_9FLAO|nr:hypothetical protein [Allomuricauda ochracea]
MKLTRIFGTSLYQVKIWILTFGLSFIVFSCSEDKQTNEEGSKILGYSLKS